VVITECARLKLQYALQRVEADSEGGVDKFKIVEVEKGCTMLTFIQPTQLSMKIVSDVSPLDSEASVQRSRQQTNEGSG